MYTDGFCYSCCSVFTKGLKERGSAILVGYNGDPRRKGIKQFDVGQSPSSVMAFSSLVNDQYNVLKKSGFDMTFTFVESFKYNYSYSERIPREFIIDEIDERVDIQSFDETNIDLFTKQSKLLLEKYKTECNPLNKRLVKYNKTCDEKITIKHAHGGFACGNDGKWTTNCIATYCDEGYKFDFDKQRCIEQVCPIFNAPPPEKPPLNGSISMTIGMLLFLIVLLI